MTEIAAATTYKRVTPEVRAAYLSALAQTGSHPAACRAIGFARRTIASHLETHADFREAADDAMSQFAATLLAEAKRRAVEGVDKTVWHGGEPVGTERRYSDRLLLALLEKLGPDEFRAPSRSIVEHTGTVQHSHAHVSLHQSAMLARMPVPARLEFYRACIVHEALTGALSHGAAVQRIGDLVAEAQTHGVEIDGIEIAREARIGKFAELPRPDAIEAEFEEIEVPSFL